MKTIKLLLLVALSLCGVSCLISCGEDPTDDSLDIIGNWYGVRSYYNPAGGTKYQYLTVRFFENGAGELEYESPVSYSVGKFWYTVAGSTIECHGAYASTNGDVSPTFNFTLKKQGDRLLPQNMFSNFVLTRDGSVEVGDTGNEVIDDTDLLQRIWVRSDGLSVIEFYATSFDEYVLDAPNSKSFVYACNQNYYYDYRRRLLNINGTQWEVPILSKSVLQLVMQGQSFTYNIGSAKDLPSGPNIAKYILNASIWNAQYSSYTFGFIFRDTGSVIFQEIGPRGSVYAVGSYSVNGTRIMCDFTEVTDNSGRTSGSYSGYFGTWTYGQKCQRVYTAGVANSFDLEMTNSDGIKIYFEAL